MSFRKQYKILFFFILSFVLHFSAIAQSKTTGNKIRDLKIEFVSEKIELQPKQKNDFLHVYNQYNDELHVIRVKKRALRNNSNPEFVIEENERLDKEIIKIKSNYKEKFLKVINSEQYLKLQKAEEDFRQILIQRLNKE